MHLEVPRRRSAGAGILSFMPTIVALTSNSIDEISLVAEESTILALVLGICSSSAFTTRFGISGDAGIDSDAAVLEDLELTITDAINRPFNLGMVEGIDFLCLFPSLSI